MSRQDSHRTAFTRSAAALMAVILASAAAALAQTDVAGDARRDRTRRPPRSAPRRSGASWPTAAPSCSIPASAPNTSPATSRAPRTSRRRAGAPPAAYIAAVEQLVGGDKSKALVLYCNGQNCQASRTLSEQLVDGRLHQCAALPARHADVARAQRAGRDRARRRSARLQGRPDRACSSTRARPTEFAKASLPGTHNVPADKLAADGLRKAPMPSNDFNTRIILFGRDGAQARALADAVGKTADAERLVFPRHVRGAGGGGEDAK